MDEPTRRLIEAIAAWDSGLANAGPIVDAATELVVEGIGAEGVAVLAGTPAALADESVHELVTPALDELDVGWPLNDRSRNAIVTTAVAARRYLAGELTARGLCSLVHQRHGHATHPLVEALSRLDDAYDNVELVGWSEERIGPEVDVAVGALIDGEERLLDGTPLDEL